MTSKLLPNWFDERTGLKVDKIPSGEKINIRRGCISEDGLFYDFAEVIIDTGKSLLVSSNEKEFLIHYNNASPTTPYYIVPVEFFGDVLHHLGNDLTKVMKTFHEYGIYYTESDVVSLLTVVLCLGYRRTSEEIRIDGIKNIISK